MKPNKIKFLTAMTLVLLLSNCAGGGGGTTTGSNSDADGTTTSISNDNDTSSASGDTTANANDQTDPQGQTESDEADDATSSSNTTGTNQGTNTTGSGSGSGSGSNTSTTDPDAIKEIDAGNSFSCSLKNSGTVSCVGLNIYGVLGDTNTPDSVTPILLTFPTASPIIDISTGTNHACAVDEDGEVWCWGRNHYGQLGSGDDVAVSGIIHVPGFGSSRPAIQVSSGNIFNCALTEEGSIYCWGGNLSGQLGNGSTGKEFAPVQVSDIDTATNPAVEVEAGSSFTCARFEDGAVKCWGTNTSGELGIGSTTTNFTTPQTLADFDSNNPAIDIGLGSAASHACALSANGVMKCWGRNTEGQLGDSTNTDSNLPVSVTGIDANSPAMTISVGGMNSCAVLTTGAAKCWGASLYGQTGSNTNPYSTNVPLDVVSSLVAEEINVGQSGQACFWNSNNEAECWGYNPSGEIGSGNAFSTFSAVTIDGINAHTANPRIAAGNKHTCAVSNDNFLKCWGSNYYSGQLGDGSFEDSPTPVTVANIDGNLVEKISLGSENGCVLQTDNIVKCWGQGLYGRLGNGSDDTSTVAVTVTGATGAINYKDITSGYAHTCILRQNGRVYCWGLNSSGQLGNGTTTNSNIPVLVSTITLANPAIDIEAGRDHTCALLTDGSAQCWGANSSHQQGHSLPTPVTTPTAVDGVTSTNPANKIAAGRDHTCFAMNDGTVSCFGSAGIKQLGDYSDLSLSFELQPHGHFSSANPVLDIVSGIDSLHSCALVTDGTVQCWGSDTFGQLGSGTNRIKSSWTDMIGNERYAIGSSWVVTDNISNAVGIAVGEAFSCAIISDGTVKCWGSNSESQIGSAIPVSSDFFAPVDSVF